jgi:hypothetical protein
MFKIDNKIINVNCDTINKDIPDVKINKKLTKTYLASKHISNIQINNINSINTDLNITLKHIYIDLYNFIISNEANTSACNEYKDILLKTILQHLNK